MEILNVLIDGKRILIGVYDISNTGKELEEKLTIATGVKWKCTGAFMDTCSFVCSEEDFEKIKNQTFTMECSTYKDD